LSSGAEHCTGYSAQELVGLPITQILADASAFEVPHILDTVKQWGHWQGEIVQRTRSGELLEAWGFVSLLNGDRASGYLLVSSLKGSAAFDEGAGSLAEIAANLRTLAHDMNNPLAVIMGFTQLLILNEDCRGKIRNDVEKLYSELKRVIQAVEKLQHYARSLYGNAQPDRSAPRRNLSSS
jgi:signal transduction histidine kinase